MGWGGGGGGGIFPFACGPPSFATFTWLRHIVDDMLSAFSSHISVRKSFSLLSYLTNYYINLRVS